MADLDANDITVTLVNQRRVNGRTYNVVKLVFGANSDLYPAGGIPISKGKLGCPNVIESLTVFDAGTSGYKWSYDRVNEKLVATQPPSHSHDLLFKNNAAADTAITRVNVNTGVLGANTGNNITIAGGGANGGVVASTVASMAAAEPTGVDISTQTLHCEVVGW